MGNVKINLLNSDLSVKTNMSNKTKNKKIKQELNLLDNLISDDAEAFLANEVHHGSLKGKRCELRAKKQKAVSQRPTTVTFVNVRGGKKNRRTIHEGLRVLLDTGCSDFLLLAEYVKKNNKIKKP